MKQPDDERKPKVAVIPGGMTVETEEIRADLAQAAARLAEMSAVAYEQERRKTARAFGVRMSVLDDLVAAARAGSERRTALARPGRADHLNLRLAIETDPQLNTLLRFNELSHEIELTGPVPRPGGKRERGFVARAWRDTDATAFAEVLIAKGYERIMTGMVEQVVAVVAQEARYHPVRDYLRGLKWDGVERLSAWLETYAGAIVRDDPAKKKRDGTVVRESHEHYVKSVARASLIAAVARAMKPGCKADHVPVLIGKQGRMKSSMLRALVPDPAWFAENISADMSGKDAMNDLRGKWLIELAEMPGLGRSHHNDTKSFLSRRHDHFRPPFGRTAQDFPRQCVFFGSINEAEFLTDPTGNRRFWPIDITTARADALEEVRDQLWAEALAAYDSAEAWWLSAADERVAEIEQDEHRAENPLTGEVADYLKTQRPASFVIRDYLKNELGAPMTQWSTLEKLVAASLRELGWEKKRRREPDGGRNINQWEPPEVEPEEVA